MFVCIYITETACSQWAPFTHFTCTHTNKNVLVNTNWSLLSVQVQLFGFIVSPNSSIYVVVYHSTPTVCSSIMSNRLRNTVMSCVKPICCLLVLTAWPVRWSTSHPGGRGEASLSPCPASCSHAWKRRGGGKPSFREKETHDGANNPQGCFSFFFKAIMNQTGSLQLPIQSITTARIPIRSINNHFKIINAGNLFSSVILF